MKNVILIPMAALLLMYCTSGESRLPILGVREWNGTDTVYHTIAPFKFTNQDSATVTNDTFKDHIYVADFFFTSCRTICPIMKTQMLRVYESIQSMEDVGILSHTIDPDYDSVALLRDFARRLDVSSDKWHFVTGEKDTIYKVAQTSYYVTAMEDQTSPDGFVHSGAFMLIDKQGRIRGMYDGTNEAEVNQLILDIKRLRRQQDVQ